MVAITHVWGQERRIVSTACQADTLLRFDIKRIQHLFCRFSNRLPMPSDNLSHWSDVFMWRHHHYQAIVAAYETQAQHEPVSEYKLKTTQVVLGLLYESLYQLLDFSFYS